ncbi:DEAD/DEAH box helicase [Herpetosiphon geysericola]|uniref:DEAD/DEAH box helicase n=1 Tax=Herpetosiphon geysericola TaxID=70996 RepID=A0A0N8GP87_9CHLR|nr:DEAD/DEAH box helicase [Herpetosiphon geysericola]KPL80210.1 hypothetical protein SE18_24445 [Herpetosiphon geysericola]
MQLRLYQIESVTSVQKDWQDGATDVLGVAATGAGKTQIMLSTMLGHADIPPVLVDGKRGLLIAHREELIRQPYERIASYWKHWLPNVGIVKAEENQPHRQMVIATVQSLHAKRLQTLLHYGPIDYLAIDECHHATADSYMELYQALKKANPNLRHMGVTATPQRADDIGLITVYQKNSFAIDIGYLVREGYLVPFKSLELATRTSLKGVRKTGNDLNAGQLKHVFELSNVFELVVDSYIKYAQGRKSIAFTVSVEGAHDLAAAFTKRGITAIAIDGTTPKEERRRILAAFSRGEYMVLTNCAVLTEGFDQPDIGCVMMVRPTVNRSLFVQCVGRGLRTAPGKDDCLVLEFAPSSGHNLASLGDVLGLPREVIEASRQAADEAEEGDVIGGMSFDGQDVHGLEGNPLELVARQIDYLKGTALHWERRDGWMILGLGEGGDGYERILAITPPMMTDPFKLFGLMKPKGTWDWSAKQLASAENFGELAEVANQYAEERGARNLMLKTASWKHQPASEGQIKYLRRLARGSGDKIKWQLLSKGDAATLITYYQTREALERVGMWR